MKVRTAKEIQSLDDELNLFNEESWEFLGVVEQHDINYEYFNDIQDIDFRVKNKRQVFVEFIPFMSLIFVVILCSFLAVSRTGAFDYSEYNEMLNQLKSQNMVSTVKYVDGIEVTDVCMADINRVLQGYVNTLRAEKSYNDLYNYCATTSTFADTYNKFTSQIEELMDSNDCSARMLRLFGGYCSVNRINKIIESNGQYYCYVTLTLPSSEDMYEYIMAHQYTIVMDNQSGDFTQGSLVQLLLNLISDMSVPCSSGEYCIKFTNTDDGFKIVDDSVITSTCLDTYTSSINQLITVMQEKLGNKIGS